MYISRSAERSLITYALIAQVLSWIGLVVMLIVYLVGIGRHSRAQRLGTATPDNRHVPTFRLQDMLTMVFSIGTFLSILQLVKGAALGERELNFIVGAGVIFPAAFVCMLYRLNANRVPPCGWRIVLLFLSPYALMLNLATVALGLIAIFAVIAGSNRLIILGAFAAVFVLCWYVLHRIACGAKAAANTAHAMSNDAAVLPVEQHTM